MFSISAFAVQLQFYRKGGVSYFSIREIPEKTKVFIKGNYFVAFFCCERVKKELFESNLKDGYFSSFFVENVDDNGSRVIIATNKPYVPSYSYKNDNRTIIVKAVLPKKKAPQRRRVYSPVPDSLVATPFYISSYVFYKKVSPESASYDESLFFMGVKYFTLKNYAYAMSFFKEIVEKYPQSPFYVSSYFLLGDCYLKLKEYDKALSVYRKAIGLSPKNDTVAQTLFNMAKIYRKLGYYSQARRVYQTVVNDYLNTKWADEARYLLAKTYYEQKNYRKALSELMNINKKSPYYPLSMLLAAEIFIKQKNMAKAVLAYYAISNALESINVNEHYRELIDVAAALCRFEDYAEADKIFSHIEKKATKDEVQYAYLGKMKCDLDKGDYKDLKEKAKYILSSSKNKKLIDEVKKLLDEAKLKEGKVSEKTIEEILRKYANDPEIASLALYVYAKKSYREANYRKALDYLLKLKRLYPGSVYNERGKKIAFDSIDKLLNQFYENPSQSLIDYLYSVEAHLRVYRDVCRIAVGLMAMGELEKMHSLLPFVTDSNCKSVLYAKYYIEMGKEAEALKYLENVEAVEPYVYYADIVMGDINYFKGSYTKAYQFYIKASRIKINLISQYAKLGAMRALLLAGEYKKVVGLFKDITLKSFKDKALFIEAKALFSMGDYKGSIDTFGQLKSVLEYKEQALFYLALSYSKLGKMDKAKDYFKQLEKLYPKSEYLKTLKVILE